MLPLANLLISYHIFSFLRVLKSPLVPEAEAEALEVLPFRVVSAGLEGETTFVLQGDGRDEKWRDAIMSSTLPFGSASLPTLVPNCRKELEDR